MKATARRHPFSLKPPHTVRSGLFLALGLSLLPPLNAAPLFTESSVKNPPFSELKLPQEETFKGPVQGSKIRVDHALVEVGPVGDKSFDKNIKIHVIPNSAVGRQDFGKWTRWYQEDGKTQIFRLFDGETNTRNARANAARVEAFSALAFEKGPWHEWQGRYTIVKPQGAAIFQSKNNKNDWSVQINMSSSGTITLNHRRGQDVPLATNMTGKSFDLKVRDNGHDYEVYFNGEKVGTGSWPRPSGHTNFRWGMYLGKAVSKESMIFVSGATFK